MAWEPLPIERPKNEADQERLRQLDRTGRLARPDQWLVVLDDEDGETEDEELDERMLGGPDETRFLHLPGQHEQKSHGYDQSNEGRPGLIGGSGPGDGEATKALVEKLGTASYFSAAAFITRDGTLVRGHSTHHQVLAEKSGTTLDILEKEGMIRLVPGGASTATVPSELQAQVLAENWGLDREYRTHYLDVGEDQVLFGSIVFEGRVTAEALRNFAKQALTRSKDQPALHVRRLTSRETLLHQAADKHLASLTVAVRYAFAAARKSVAKILSKATSASEAERIMRKATDILERELMAVLPGTLTRIVRSGGEAGMTLLKARLRVGGRRAAEMRFLHLPGQHEQKSHGYDQSNEGSAPSGGPEIQRGVNADANAARETERFLGWQFPRPTPEVLAAVEAEFRALPLVHGTSVAGAVGAIDNGLFSHQDMGRIKQKLNSDIHAFEEELKAMLPARIRAELVYADLAEVKDVLMAHGMSSEDADLLTDKVVELRSIKSVLEGSTNQADKALDLDQYVFMTHGAKHTTYGNVGVVIDNSALNDDHAFATEHDIIFTPGILSATSGSYDAEGVENYRATIVKGDGYIKTAAAKAGSIAELRNRTANQLFEVKVPRVSRDRVKGFIVNDRTEAERLSRMLAKRGLTNKVLHTSGINPHDQLKHIQKTGAWDPGGVGTIL